MGRWIDLRVVRPKRASNATCTRWPRKADTWNWAERPRGATNIAQRGQVASGQPNRASTAAHNVDWRTRVRVSTMVQVSGSKLVDRRRVWGATFLQGVGIRFLEEHAAGRLRWGRGGGGGGQDDKSANGVRGGLTSSKQLFLYQAKSFFVILAV